MTRQGIVNDTEHDDPAGGSGGTAPDPTGSTDRGRRSSPPLIAALVLGVVLVAGVAVAGIVLGPSDSTPAPAPTAAAGPPATGPVLLVPVDAPQAGSAACTSLLDKLPATLPNGKTPLHSRPLAKPVQVGAAVWGGGNGDPVVLRCGIERPPELTPTSELLAINGVQWLQISSDGLTTWYAVDRAVVVALTLPGNVGTGPIQEVSDTITATLPAKSVF